MSSPHPYDALSAYLDGELTPGDRAQVEAHLAGCAPCSERLSELAAVDALARDMPVDVPAGYFEALPARIRARVPARPRKIVPAWAMLAAASLLLAVLAPLVLEQRLSRSAPAPAAMPAPASASENAARNQVPETPARPYVQGTPPAEMRSAVPKEWAPPASQPPFPVQQDAPKRRAAGGEPLDERLTSDIQRGAEAGKAEGNVVPREQEGFAAPPQAPPPPAPATTAAAGARPRPRPRPRPEPEPEPEPERETLEGRAERDKRQNAPAPPGLAGAAADTAEEKPAPRDRERDDDARASSSRGAAPSLMAKAADPQVRLRALSARKAGSADEARALREGWRRLAKDLQDATGGDEARVRVIEMGAEAWRLGHAPDDLALLQADALAYLKRSDARQSDRVRGLLRRVSPSTEPR